MGKQKVKLTKFCCGWDWRPRPGLIFSIINKDKTKCEEIARHLRSLNFSKETKGHFNASVKTLTDPDYKSNIEAISKKRKLEFEKSRNEE